MDWLISIFAENKLLTALANVGGAATLIYIVVRFGLKWSRFLFAAYRSSLREARRRQRVAAAIMAFRCAEDASTFIAVIIRHILQFLLFMFLLTSFLIGGINPVSGYYGSAVGPVALQGKIEIVLLALAVSILIFRLFSSLANLAASVMTINERRRLSRRGVKGLRRRIRFMPVF